MKNFALLVFLVVCVCPSHARLLLPKSYQTLFQEADMVCVAKIVKSEDVADLSEHDGDKSWSEFAQAVRTEFEVLVSLKGDGNTHRFSLYHYRDKDGRKPYFGGNGWIQMTKTENTNEHFPFLLFVKLDKSGDYIPVTRQEDANLSVMKLPVRDYPSGVGRTSR